MAGKAVMDTLGVVSGTLGIISFFQSQQPGDSPDGTAVTVKAGISSVNDDVGGFGGQVNAVYGYDQFNAYLGKSSGAKVKEGDVNDFIIDQGSPGTQAQYVSLANGNDGTCITWVAVANKDGKGGGAWTGDIGYQCGQRWHAGGQVAGTYKSGDREGEDWEPYCTWIDKDFTDDTKSAAFKFNVRAYGDKVEDTVGNDVGCDSTIWSEDSDAIADEPAKKRSMPERPQWIIERLITTALINGTTAEELCTSSTSWGPDYIGSDRKFCDMDQKELLPLCEIEEVEGCVDFDDTDLSIKKRSTVAGRRSVRSVHKSYKTITTHGKNKGQ
ncbi:hypothetical protein Q7P37_006239 [Cladosporium fusiforme]